MKPTTPSIPGHILLGTISTAEDGTVLGIGNWGDYQHPTALQYQADGAYWLVRDEFQESLGAVSLLSVGVGSSAHVWAAGRDDAGKQLVFVRENETWTSVVGPVPTDRIISPHVGSDGTVVLRTSDAYGRQRQLFLRTPDGWTELTDGDLSWGVGVGSADFIVCTRHDGTGKLYKLEGTDSWKAIAGPPPAEGYSQTYYGDIAATSDGRILVAVYHDNATGQGKHTVASSDDGGTTWTTLDAPEAATTSLNTIGLGPSGSVWLQGKYVYRSDDTKTWTQVLSVTIPSATAVAKVKANLGNLIDLNDRYHDYLQDNVSEAYNLIGLEDTDPGQALATAMMSLSIGAIGQVPIPGAGVASGVLGAAFNWAIEDSGTSWGGTFGTIWKRLSANALETRSFLSELNSNVVDKWNERLVNPVTGTELDLGDLVDADIPSKSESGFTNILKAMLVKGRYQLWKGLVPKQWHRVHVVNESPLGFKSKSEANDFLERYVDKNPQYYGTVSKVKHWYGTRYEVKLQWLGYGVLFPYGFHDASADMCNRLFKDDGLGKIVRPDSITTRQEVFTSWGLQEQGVVMPGGPPSPVLDRARQRARFDEVSFAPAQ